MVVQLTSNTLVAYVDEQEFRAIPSKDQTAIRRVATVKRWPYRYLPPAVQITIQPSFLNEGIEAHIRRLVFQLAEAAAKKHQVVPNYKAGHSPGVVDYLREELALTDLKQPDWWRGLRPQPTSKLLQRMRIPKSFEYVLEGGKRTVFPAHRHHQIRLVKWLRNQVVKLETEDNYVDIRFKIGEASFLGEIKIIQDWLLPRQAFRAALGQILDYGFSESGSTNNLIIFLDEKPEAIRIELATSLKIAVVIEEDKRFVCLNPQVDARLLQLFPPPPAGRSSA